MTLIKRFRGPWGLASCGLLFLALIPACSNPGGLNSDRGTEASRDTNHAGSAPASVSTVTAQADPKSGLPFRDSENLPAGTLLTVRLKTSISADNPGDNTFTAEIDEPVVIEGNMFLTRGTGVSGRFEFSRLPEIKGNRGYFRLTLDEIDLGGTALPVQTSRLFARGHTPDDLTSMEKGHRLTFRLAEPVYLAKQLPAPGH